MVFRDGTEAEADAIVGCDGIKSRMREIIVGHGDPSAKCSYTHKFAYRGMVPMGQAVEVLGEERAVNATIWVSHSSFRGLPTREKGPSRETNQLIRRVKICIW